MILLCLIAAAAGFALFGLSTDAHAQARLRVRPSRDAKRVRRLAGWALLVLSFGCAVIGGGWVFGPVLWVGAIMFAAGLVFLALNLLPKGWRL